MEEEQKVATCLVAPHHRQHQDIEESKEENSFLPIAWKSSVGDLGRSTVMCAALHEGSPLFFFLLSRSRHVSKMKRVVC